MASYCGVLLGLALLFVTGLSRAEEAHPETHLPLPGQSIANINLQRDSLAAVMVSGRAANPDCKAKNWQDMYIADTRVTLYPKKPGVTPWTELWTVDACGKLVEVPIRFLPSYPRPGVTYEVSKPLVVKATPHARLLRHAAKQPARHSDMVQDRR